MASLGAVDLEVAKTECSTPPFHIEVGVATHLIFFNPNETCHMFVYTIYLYRSTSGFLAQEPVWERETTKDRKYIFLQPL